jgi:hypothetical protein
MPLPILRLAEQEQRFVQEIALGTGLHELGESALGSRRVASAQPREARLVQSAIAHGVLRVLGGAVEQRERPIVGARLERASPRMKATRASSGIVRRGGEAVLERALGIVEALLVDQELDALARQPGEQARILDPPRERISTACASGAPAGLAQRCADHLAGAHEPRLVGANGPERLPRSGELLGLGELGARPHEQLERRGAQLAIALVVPRARARAAAPPRPRPPAPCRHQASPYRAAGASGEVRVASSTSR